jgi:hypothetical protein
MNPFQTLLSNFNLRPYTMLLRLEDFTASSADFDATWARVFSSALPGASADVLAAAAAAAAKEDLLRGGGGAEAGRCRLTPGWQQFTPRVFPSLETKT